MTNINEAVIARLKSNGHDFEILVDCNKAMDFKTGKEIPLSDILAIEKIFSDSKKGMEPSEVELKNAFNTDNVEEIAKKIIKKGDIQLTSEYKAKIREIGRASCRERV